MKQAILNALTGEVTFEDVDTEDIETSTEEYIPIPTMEERVDSVETKTATLEETIDELFRGVK